METSVAVCEELNVDRPERFRLGMIHIRNRITQNS